jgi:outer membrane protein assembly factor BamB
MYRELFILSVILPIIISGCEHGQKEFFQDTSTTTRTETQENSSASPEYNSLLDSPWPMFHGNLFNTGLSPYDTSHVNGTEIWSFETEDGIESSPAVGVDGIIYFGSHDGNLYAVNPDGTEKWRFYAGPPNYDERWKVSKSIMASPAVASDGTIYIYSSANYLYAIRPDGTKKWQFYVKWHNDFWSSPTIGPDGTIYIGSARSQEDPNYDGGLHAINPDGTEKWLFPDDSGVTSTAAIGTDGTIYFGGNELNPHGEGNVGKIYAIYPDGTKKWEYTTENWMESSPAIGPDGVIYIGSGKEGNIYAINPDGSERWRFHVDIGVSAVPAIGADGTIYIGAWDSNFYALNPDGSEKWRFKTPDAFEGVSSSAAIGADGTVYVGSNSGHFYAFEADGTVKWVFETQGSGIVTSPAIGSDGKIYFGSWNRNMYAIGGQQTAIDSGEKSQDIVRETPANCKSEPLFTTSPIDFEHIRNIVPLGNLNPPSHTFPTDHIYFYISRQEGADHADVVNLYSPGELTITRVSASEHVKAGFTDYSIFMGPCDEVTVMFYHVSSLSESIFGNISLSDGWRLNSEYTTDGETYRLWGKEYNIKVNAGDILGTTGGNPEQWALDLGVYDQRFFPESVANLERWSHNRYLHAICPLSFFEEGQVLDKLRSLVQRDEVEGDINPCGSVMQDIPGTAQGSWFLSGVEDTYPEDPHLALVYSNIHPSLAVLSVGTSISNLDSGTYGFLPTNSGLLNREFQDITPDGRVVGFEVDGFNGIIILQMVDSNTIWIEALKGVTSNSSSWKFTENKTIFVR